MDSKKVLYAHGGGDECYTPAYGVRPILKYVPEGAIVWCPFDTERSEFVKLIKAQGNQVIHTHIDTGHDFFSCEPVIPWDMIISNPPFKNKKQFFKRALSFGKPICLLGPMTWLNDSGSKLAFQEEGRKMQLLMFDNRMEFNRMNGKKAKTITFSSGYYCSDFLPEDLILGGKLDKTKQEKPVPCPTCQGGGCPYCGGYGWLFE
jgi:hypothetical protein